MAMKDLAEELETERRLSVGDPAAREQLIALLEAASIQCYDHESDNELRTALLANVEDGTITLADGS